MRGLAAAAALALALPVAAAEDLRDFPLKPVLDWPGYQKKLDPGVRLFFRGEQAPQVLQKFGIAGHKQRAVKTDGEFCAHVLVASLAALQAKARQASANALVDIVTVHNSIETPTAGRYQCQFGAAAVLLEIHGEMAKVP